MTLAGSIDSCKDDLPVTTHRISTEVINRVPIILRIICTAVTIVYYGTSAAYWAGRKKICYESRQAHIQYTSRATIEKSQTSCRPF